MQETKQITEYRRQLKQRIVEYSMQAFVNHGIKAVKMDDIADELQISKRTLYEIFSNKEELLFYGLKQYYDKRNEKLKQYAQSTTNVMEIVLFAFNCHMEELGGTCTEFFNDLQKYPAISEFFAKKRNEQRCDFTSFLKRGIDGGYFRNDFNFDLIENLIYGILQMVHVERLYEKFPMQEVFYNIIQMIFRFICTEKGMQELDNFKK